MYAHRVRRRSAAPRRRREDLTSLILGTEFGGEPMTDIDFGSFFVQLVTAGNDTTKTMLSSGLLALLEHPDQLAELRADPSLDPRRGRGDPALGQPAALLPAHRHRRTPSCAGTQIAAGDKVAMYYTSANRDEDVFADPHALRHPPRPEPAPVVRHRRALLPRRAPRPPRGPGVLRGAAGHVPDDRADRRARSRIRSNLNNALKRLPVRLG